MTTVADASVVIRMLANYTTDEPLRRRLTRRVVHAPAHLDAEILNGIRGMLLGGKITIAGAATMLNMFSAMHNIVRHRTNPHLMRTVELFHNFTAYDALYVALAEKLRATLFTRDSKYGQAPAHKADVHVYP